MWGVSIPLGFPHPTLELLGLVIDQVPMVRMLTVVTARPEIRPPWAPRSHLTQLTLGRLPRPQVETMVQQLTGRKPLPADLMATRGRSAPEVELTYAQARALCAQVGETPQLILTLRGLSGFYETRGALPTARELGEQLYRLAQRAAGPTPRIEAHDALGTTLFYVGEYADALLSLATAQRFPQWVGYGTFWQGWILAAQGQGEAGLAQMRQGMAAVWTTGQTLARPFGLILLAEAAGHAGGVPEGLHLLAEAYRL
jgi:hypothetical protein